MWPREACFATIHESRECEENKEETTKHKLAKFSDCVFGVVKCSTVTIIVDTYLHIELNFRLKQNALALSKVTIGSAEQNMFADNFAKREEEISLGLETERT